MCRSVNKKKAVLDAKADTSTSTPRLLLLEKDLEDLKARVGPPSSASKKKKILLQAPDGRQKP
jgi:hypothetical protein